MRILILGANGRTGRHLLSQALDRGHDVTVLVRDKRKIPTFERLNILEGSVLNKEKLGEAIQGTAAILSALNVSRNSDWPWSGLRSPADFLSATMKNIIALAPLNGVTRIVFTSAWGVAETKKNIPGWFRWFINNSNLKYPYADHERQERLIADSSLDWTSVRLAGLTDSKKAKSIVTSINNQPRPHLTISRRDAARFMLDAVENGLFIRQAVVVSSR